MDRGTETDAGKMAVFFLAAGLAANWLGAHDLAVLALMVFACCLDVYVLFETNR